MVHLADFGLSAEITSEGPAGKGHAHILSHRALALLSEPFGSFSPWPRVEMQPQDTNPWPGAAAQGSGRNGRAFGKAMEQGSPCSDGIWLWLKEPGWHRGCARAAGNISKLHFSPALLFSSVG